MAGLIKTQAGPLVAALALCALPLGERQTQRIPALGAVRLAGGSDGLSITATSFDGTITTWLDEAEADGEVALPAERFADLARHFPADADTLRGRPRGHGHLRQGFKLPVFPFSDLPARLAFAGCDRREPAPPAFLHSDADHSRRSPPTDTGLPYHGSGRDAALKGSLADHRERDDEGH